MTAHGCPRFLKVICRPLKSLVYAMLFTVRYMVVAHRCLPLVSDRSFAGRAAQRVQSLTAADRGWRGADATAGLASGGVTAALVLAVMIAVAHAETQPGGRPQLYVGGVAGIADLLDPAHSQRFRAAGGGLYLHNTGWMRLDWKQQEQILRIFSGVPIAIELGFVNGAWGNAYQKAYLAHGIKPDFIAANAFANNHRPTLAEWAAYTTDLRQHGLPSSTLVLPTFEYQNFGPNRDALPSTRVSVSANLQALIAAAGGLVLDTPPSYALGREPAYREWVTDAIRWTKGRGLKTVVILSPHDAGAQWGEDTAQYVRYLDAQRAMPAAFVCENYAASAPSSYPNRVGADALPSSVVGVCDLMRDSILPSLAKAVP